MTKTKFYFKNQDSNHCYALEVHLEEAKEEGLKSLKLIEAIPDNQNKDFIFCTYHGEVGERRECKKSNCKEYASKSGRGVCKLRGNLFAFGDTKTFNI